MERHMTISNELMLAILAMDSYNRGYNAGVGAGPNGLGITGFVGNAEIKKVEQESAAKAASFFAISYTLNNTTVISYRGTDAYNPFLATTDITTGWVTGAGILGSQALLAHDFFKTVVQGNASAATDQAALRASNVVFTGHSLGGGLAAYLAGVYSKRAVIYDNMPFELAAQRVYDLSVGVTGT
jgi:fermentation-respiration switch protein FrsA (DUF1100 family)